MLFISKMILSISDRLFKTTSNNINFNIYCQLYFVVIFISQYEILHIFSTINNEVEIAVKLIRFLFISFMFYLFFVN
jgi:hypothetical protein